MAFVFKKEKDIDFTKPNSAFYPGPGEYLSQTNPKKIKFNINAPFETQEQRMKDKEPNLNPGPGSYYIDKFQ